MKLYITRLFTFTWCLFILASCIIYTTSQCMHFAHDPHKDFPAVYLMGTIGGVLLSIVPLVFLGVAPSIILESLVEKECEQDDYYKGVNGLTINYKSWHGGRYLIGEEGSTLCSHCWLVAIRLILSLGAVLVASTFAVIVSPFMLIILVIFTVIKLLMFLFLGLIAISCGWKIKSWKNVLYFVFLDMRGDSAKGAGILFSYPEHKQRALAKIEVRKPWPTPKFIIFIKEFLSSSWDIIKALKENACPTIRWKFTVEDTSKYED